MELEAIARKIGERQRTIQTQDDWFKRETIEGFTDKPGFEDISRNDIRRVLSEVCNGGLSEYLVYAIVGTESAYFPEDMRHNQKLIEKGFDKAVVREMQRHYEKKKEEDHLRGILIDQINKALDSAVLGRTDVVLAVSEHMIDDYLNGLFWVPFPLYSFPYLPGITEVTESGVVKLDYKDCLKWLLYVHSHLESEGRYPPEFKDLPKNVVGWINALSFELSVVDYLRIDEFRKPIFELMSRLVIETEISQKDPRLRPPPVSCPEHVSPKDKDRVSKIKDIVRVNHWLKRLYRCLNLNMEHWVTLAKKGVEEEESYMWDAPVIYERKRKKGYYAGVGWDESSDSWVNLEKEDTKLIHNRLRRVRYGAVSSVPRRTKKEKED